MKCPACDVTLVMADRQGIEIDYCPQCRGVWLDRGELDKIIERTANLAPPPQAAQPQQQPPRQPSYPPQHHGDDYYRHKKKKNLLGELFDF
jgi:Zn-finger nucleic acid-binding protein